MHLTSGNTKMPGILSVILTLGVFFWVYILAFVNVPEGNKAILFSVLGSYMSGWLMCIGYYVGTTFSSGAKDNMIYNSTPSKKEDEK